MAKWMGTGMLGGRYRLTHLLGTGDTGDVWQAHDDATGHLVAIKLIHSHLVTSTRLADRLQRSRAVLTGLWHRNIARMQDVIIDDGQLAVVTDYVEGSSLDQSSAHPLEIAKAVAAGLSAAHRLGIAHGDLKPANIIVAHSNPAATRITDFCLDALIRAGRSRTSESPYAAPEVIDGAVASPAGDIYAFGVLLHDLLGSTPDAQLHAIITACLHEDPASRPSAEDLCTALESCTAPTGKPANTARHAVRELPASQPRTARWLAVATAGILVAAAFVTFGLLSNNGTAIPPTAAPSATTAAPATEPAMPAAAQTDTPEAGEAFVRYWFALLNYATASGDTKKLATVTRAECTQCATATAAIRASHSGGGTVQGGHFTVRQVTNSSLWTPQRPIFDTTVDRSIKTTTDASGATTGTVPGLTFTNCVVVLERTGDGWRLYEVTTPGCLA
ncbi:DUF6318 family protein [Catelliglobosispora koreensis]|uniref:DUF6318 family protein n=1 Tax=Catelliglobosispora koreensis TaxID=129052 RepID=UPI000A029989|nr:DUF6318 family protein [Catelliglobosispora koreensis]